MTAIAFVDTPAVPAVPAVSETAAIIQMIERAATNSTVDLDKMERLLHLQERILDRNARVAFQADFAEMQAQLPTVEKNGRIVIKEKGGERVIQSTRFALWEDINDAIKPILRQYGFLLSFRTSQASDGKLIVTCILGHRGGHREETSLALMHDGSGSKNAVQAVGSSTSYGKRYTACSMLNITTRGEDDDGKKGGADACITNAQADEIRALALEVRADMGRFLKYMNIESIDDIKSADFARAIAALETKRPKGNGA